MTISTWPLSDRPREKLLSQSAKILTDAELLAIFLGSGVRGKTALDLARELLKNYGSLKQILQTKPEDLYRQSGFGKAKYALLKAFPNNKPDLNTALTEASTVRFSKYNLKNIFHLFYPTGQFTDNVADNIVNIANSETANIDQWRMAILTICASPNWTVP